MEAARKAHSDWLFRQLGDNNSFYESGNLLQQWATDQFKALLSRSSEARLREIAADLSTTLHRCSDGLLEGRVDEVYKALIAKLPEEAIKEVTINRYTLESLLGQGYTVEEFTPEVLELLKEANLSNARRFLNRYESVLDRDSEAFVREIIEQAIDRRE